MLTEDKDEADKLIKGLIKRRVELAKVSEEEARKIELHNIGYYAGYYNQETRKRVEILFDAPHPILGSYKEKLTSRQIFEIGAALAVEEEKLEKFKEDKDFVSFRNRMRKQFPGENDD